MRRRWVIGLALAVAGWVLAGGPASAQTPAQAPAPTPAQDSVVVPPRGAPSLYAVPPSPIFDAAHAPEPAEEPAPPQGLVKKCMGKCKSCLNKYGLCCWSHHNTLGCSNFEAQYRFIFSSCRTFYGEPCERRPPASPSGAPGAPSAYGYNSGGCACP